MIKIYGGEKNIYTKFLVGEYEEKTLGNLHVVWMTR
jgi:hypothetical protein